MLWSRQRRANQRDRRPVGALPYGTPPRCGLYQAQLTDSPPTDASPAIRHLHRSISSELQREGCAGNARERRAFDLLSVCSVVEPVSTTAENGVHLICTPKSFTTTVRFTYHLANDYVVRASRHSKAARDTVAFFFPFSECGPHVESFSAKVNNVPLFGEIVRTRRSDGRLIPSHEKFKSAFLGETSDMSDGSGDEGEEEEKRGAEGEAADSTPERGDARATRRAEKLLYYFIAPEVKLTMLLPVRSEAHPPASAGEGNETADTRGSLANTTPFRVEVSWRCKSTTAAEMLHHQGEPIHVVYSLYNTPRYPDYISLLVKPGESQRIRVIRSPNCRGGVTLRARMRGATARIHAETILGDPLRQYRLPDDYLFVFQVFLGDLPKVFEEVSKWGATAVLVVVAYFVWFCLTRDLVL